MYSGNFSQLLRTMHDQVRNVVHRFVGALNRADSEAQVELFAENAVVDAGPLFEGPFAGRESIRRFFDTYLRSVSEMTIVVRDVFVNEGEAIAILEVYATTQPTNPDPRHIADWQGGKRLSWKGAFHFAATDEPEPRIQSLRIFGDERAVRWLPGIAAE
jgi:ketosteroid isomerase-like protein